MGNLSPPADLLEATTAMSVHCTHVLPVIGSVTAEWGIAVLTLSGEGDEHPSLCKNSRLFSDLKVMKCLELFHIYYLIIELQSQV